MIVNMNGLIAEVGQPRQFRTSNGETQYAQTCLLQHQFATAQNNFNKWVAFDVISTSTRKNISTFALKVGDEIEVSLDVNVQKGNNGVWFNRITCFAVERDRRKWHIQNANRTLAVPTPSSQQPAQQQTTYTQQTQPAQQPTQQYTQQPAMPAGMPAPNQNVHVTIDQVPF